MECYKTDARIAELETDNAKLRAALEQVERWTKFYQPLAEGSSWEETLREVAQFAQSALLRSEGE
jgi:hypothetical protein